MTRPPVAKQPAPPAQRLNVRALKQDLDDSGGEGMYFRPEVGLTKLRILPVPDADTFYVANLVGFVRGEKAIQRFVSPRTLDSEAYCPMFEASKLLALLGRKEDSRDFAPTATYYCNAVVYDPQVATWTYRPTQLTKGMWKLIAAYVMANIADGDLDSDGFISDMSLADVKTGKVIAIRKKAGLERPEVTVTAQVLPAKPEWLSACRNFEDELVPSDVDIIEAAVCEALGVASMDELRESVQGRTAKAAVAHGRRASAPSIEPPAEEDPASLEEPPYDDGEETGEEQIDAILAGTDDDQPPDDLEEPIAEEEPPPPVVRRHANAPTAQRAAAARPPAAKPPVRTLPLRRRG